MERDRTLDKSWSNFPFHRIEQFWLERWISRRNVRFLLFYSNVFFNTFTCKSLLISLKIWTIGILKLFSLFFFFFTIEIDYETKWFFSLKRSQAIVGDTKRDIQIFWHASRTRKETSRELCWLERWRRNVLGSDCGW